MKLAEFKKLNIESSKLYHHMLELIWGKILPEKFGGDWVDWKAISGLYENSASRTAGIREVLRYLEE